MEPKNDNMIYDLVSVEMNTISQAHYYGSIPVNNITCQSLKDMLIGKVQCAENTRI